MKKQNKTNNLHGYNVKVPGGHLLLSGPKRMTADLPPSIEVVKQPIKLSACPDHSCRSSIRHKGKHLPSWIFTAQSPLNTSHAAGAS